MRKYLEYIFAEYLKFVLRVAPGLIASCVCSFVCVGIISRK